MALYIGFYCHMLANCKRLLLKIRHAIKCHVDRYPEIYLSLCRVRPNTRELVVSKDTEIVIEGFPRSGNTFAVAAFTIAQGRPVRIARHLHAPAQVIAATRMGIPTLVLVRPPKDAVASLLIRAPYLSVGQGLKDYIHFYTTILPYNNGYVIGLFDKVTQNFGETIRKINDRFGTRFSLFQYSEENVRKVFEMVEQMDRENTGSPYVQEATVARPSEVRQRLKESISQAFEPPSAQRLLAMAEKVYQRFVELAEEGEV